MAPIDDKVVAISFESSKFESGVNKTISALDALKKALNFPTAGKGLDDINKAASRVDLSHIASGVEDIKAKLGALRLAAVAVFAELVSKAVSAGTALVKAFTIDPMKAGFAEYATNLNAIQTILANTQASGATLKDVNAALNDLNHYSDKTIYNFSQMAKNIGTFTAAGVDLKTSTASIKGIANLAALSGSNADQASTAMYQLSQAISSGAVKLQDWNSVVNAGMGGTVFQRALAQTAEAMGTIKKGTVELVGPMKNVKIAGESFRQSLSKPGKDSWLTSKVLTTTLQQFTGDLSDAQLKAEGFNAAQIKAIQQTAKTAMHAATEVKTLSQVLDVAKETAGSGWAQTWQIIFGDFGEAKKTFTDLSNTINGFINANSNARNKVLADWKALGGRTVLINGIKTAFENLGQILKPIKQAFRDIFPATTGRDLFNLTKQFKSFAEALKPSQETMDNLRRTFRGLFAVLDIGKQLISGIFTTFRTLFSTISDGSGSFLNFTGNIGDFLVSVDKALKKGDKLHNFFVQLGQVLAAPMQLIKAIGTAIGDMFSGFSPGGFFGQINGAGKALTPFQKILEGVGRVWNAFVDAVAGSGKLLRPIIEEIVKLIEGFGQALGKAASNINFELILSAIRTGLFAGLVVMFKQFLGSGSFMSQLSQNFTGGLFKNIEAPLGSLQGALVNIQNNIKAKTLKEIAIAVGILAASVLALSLVDPKKLNASLGAMTVAFGELVGAMALLTAVTKTAGFIKLPIITSSLILLAGALDLLTLAVIAMAHLDWNQLAKGLTGVGALLGILAVAAVPLSKSSGGLIRAGIGITAVAIALNLLALAMRNFGGMSWTEMGKGLVGVAGGLTLMAAATRVFPTGMVAMGVGLIAVATGLKILASVVITFSKMDWKLMGKGLAGVGGALVIIAGAMHLMPTNMIVTAAGLLAISFALGKIASAVQSMGGMSVTQIAKGLGTLAGSLVILAGALYLMSGTLAGAAALTVAAAGLALLAPVLVKLGKQSWTQIIKGLVELAAAIGILAAASLLLVEAVPAMIGLGVALVLIGGGLALAGAGVFLVGAGLSAIAVAGPTAVGILIAAFDQLVAATINAAKNLILGLLEIVKVLAATAPQFVDALVKILNSLLDVIIKASPKIAQAFTALLDAAIQVLHDNQAKIIQAGFDLLEALLQGIANNMPKIVTSVTNIIVNFLNALSSNLNRIIEAGTNLMISFIKGMASVYPRIALAAIQIMTNFLTAIGNSLSKVVTAGLSIVTKLLGAIATQLPNVVKMGVNLIVGMVTGIANAGERIVTAARQAAGKFINTLAKQIVALADQVFTAMITLINGLATVIENRAPELRSAGVHLGVAIIDGMTGGLVSKAQGLYNTISGIMGKAMGLFHSIPGVHSPSTVTTSIGGYIIDGFVKGLDGSASKAYSSAIAISNGIIKSFNDTFQTASPSKVMMKIGQYVGQGFADGLTGSADNIRSAFTDLNNKLLDAMTTARETIAKEQDKLDKLRDAKKPDAAAIRAVQAVIAQNEALLARSTAGHIALTKTLKEEKATLIGLAGDYVKIGDQLKIANDHLTEAKKTRDDAVASFSDQYSTLPDIVKTDAEGNSIDQLATYMGALDNQAKSISAYQTTLDQLRKLGLDDATYQKLLKEGPADQQFADQLLSGGKTAVKSLNTLDGNLAKVSKTLATNAGKNLYQAGVDSAQGLVNGLTKKEKAVKDEMENIAEIMLRTLRNKLGIKSPSQEFAALGVYSMQGMAQGFKDGSKMVTDAVDQAAKDALTAMQKTMRNISDVVTNELNPNPVITPVLDLTQVRTQAQELASLTTVVPITAAASYGQASIISSQQTAAQADEAAAAVVGPSVKFEQNNYSPESLTEIEIYRQTKNQLSQLKSVLAIT